MLRPGDDKSKPFSEKRWQFYTWYLIHTIGLGAMTNKTKFIKRLNKYQKFFYALQQELPCPECSYHCLEHLNNQPITEETDLFGWTVSFHNLVNTRLNKPTFTVEQSRAFYTIPGQPLVIDWIFYYYVVKILVNVAYANTTIERVCVFMDALRKVIPDEQLRNALPKSTEFSDKHLYIKKYQGTLKKWSERTQVIKKLSYGNANANTHNVVRTR
jgi:hypothetical protein